MKNMNTRTPLKIAAIAGIFIMATACQKDEPTPDYATLIIGTWRNNTNQNDYYKFTTTHSNIPDASYKEGSDWLIGETTEDQEGTEFYYKLDSNKLTMQYRNMETWLPRFYTIKELTTTKLNLEEPDGDKLNMTKVN